MALLILNMNKCLHIFVFLLYAQNRTTDNFVFVETCLLISIAFHLKFVESYSWKIFSVYLITKLRFIFSTHKIYETDLSSDIYMKKMNGKVLMIRVLINKQKIFT